MHSFKTLWFKIIFILPPIFPDTKHLRTQWTGQAIDWLPDGLIDWLIDYDGVRLCLRTATTNGPTVRSPGDVSMESHGGGDDAGWG
jgi:hypothetical protein